MPSARTDRVVLLCRPAQGGLSSPRLTWMRTFSDFVASLTMGLCYVILVVTYRLAGPRTRFRRVDQQGATFFLGMSLMQAGYWALQPLIRACCRHRVHPSTVTWLSLVPAGAAAGLAATDHWGFAAWSLLVSALFDVLDGAIARETGRMSASGAILDSVLDRYAEFIFFAGVLVFYRADLPAQLITLAALAGSFLVSYSSAWAGAFHVVLPRGATKRSDRLAVLVLGAALAPLSERLLEPINARAAWPVLAAVSLLAVLANISAIHRTTALVHEAGDRAKPVASVRGAAADSPNLADVPSPPATPLSVHRTGRRGNA